jgi:predicted DsbA family dithiol-disulfide isomerase
LTQFAASFGITDMKRADKIPNTRRALAMAEFARDQGKLDEFRSLTMDAYWKEAKDIEDDTNLRELARASGLDPDRAIMAADDPVYLDRVDAIRQEFKNLGTGGIPTVLFGTREIVEGCQPYEALVGAAVSAGAKRK